MYFSYKKRINYIGFFVIQHFLPVSKFFAFHLWTCVFAFLLFVWVATQLPEKRFNCVMSKFVQALTNTSTSAMGQDFYVRVWVHVPRASQKQLLTYYFSVHYCCRFLFSIRALICFGKKKKNYLTKFRKKSKLGKRISLIVDGPSLSNLYWVYRQSMQRGK